MKRQLQPFAKEREDAQMCWCDALHKAGEAKEEMCAFWAQCRRKFEHHRWTEGKELLPYFNNTKYDVDALDQIARPYSGKGARRRWPVTVFYNILNLAGINTHILFKECSQRQIAGGFAQGPSQQHNQALQHYTKMESVLSIQNGHLFWLWRWNIQACYWCNQLINNCIMK